MNEITRREAAKIVFGSAAAIPVFNKTDEVEVVWKGKPQKAESVRVNIDGPAMVARRHCDWLENEAMWRWMLDSSLGGIFYREAVYGTDMNGYPVRNLWRLPEEDNETYEFRRERTPVPEVVSELIQAEVRNGVFGREVAKIAERYARLKGVIEDDVIESVAGMLLLYGCIDVSTIELRAFCVPPTNMVWWMLDTRGYYAECLFRDKGGFQYWSTEESMHFSQDGSEITHRRFHGIGCVPFVRLVYRPNRRSPMIGRSRYALEAERQQLMYNSMSQKLLQDTVDFAMHSRPQSHPYEHGFPAV